MSRTNRNVEHIHSGALRHPHTFNEIRQLDGILQEEDLEGLPVSKVNHMNAKKNQLPTSWDDMTVSCWNDKNSI
jgi:hypothetical protein